MLNKVMQNGPCCKDICIDNALTLLKYAFILMYPCSSIFVGYLVLYNTFFHCNIHISLEGNNAY